MYNMIIVVYHIQDIVALMSLAYIHQYQTKLDYYYMMGMIRRSVVLVVLRVRSVGIGCLGP